MASELVMLDDTENEVRSVVIMINNETVVLTLSEALSIAANIAVQAAVLV